MRGAIGTGKGHGDMGGWRLPGPSPLLVLLLACFTFGAWLAS